VSDVIVAAIISAIFGFIGGGGGIAVYFRLRPENRRTLAEAGKFDAEADEHHVGAAARANEVLLKTITQLDASYNELLGEYTLLKAEYTKLKNAFEASLEKYETALGTLRKSMEKLEKENAELQSTVNGRKGL